MEACDMLLSCGFNKPIPLLTPRDVPKMVECVCLHSTILVIKAELDHILQGLNDVGVLESLRASPGLFKSLFVYEPHALTSREPQWEGRGVLEYAAVECQLLRNSF